MIWNWILFFGLIIYAYITDYLYNKFLLQEYKPNIEVNLKLVEVKNKPIKTVAEQLEYIKLNQKKEEMIGSGFGKLMYAILMMIVFSILIDFIPKNLLVVCAILFVIIISSSYVLLTKKYNNNILLLYNFLSAFNLALFVVVFVVIQRTNPLAIYGHKVSLLLLIPFFLLLNFVISKIKEKIYKFKQGRMDINERKKGRTYKK